jgi:hypothetical protein
VSRELEFENDYVLVYVCMCVLCVCDVYECLFAFFVCEVCGDVK